MGLEGWAGSGMNWDMLRSLIVSLAIVLIFASNASAENAAPKLYALAMHGQAKYGRDAKHLDYVNPDAPKGGTLRMAGIGTFDTLNPFSIKGKAPEGMNLVYDRLMTRVWDEPFTLYPMIAQSVDVPEDRSSITIHINPKARFQDGSAITADDVIFSYQTLKTSGRPNMRRVYQLIKTADKIDDHTVKFSLGAGYDRETVMIIAMMPVLSQKWWQGRTFDQTELDIPNTSGPYKIASIDPGRKIVYQRDSNYWAKDLMPNVGQFNADQVVYDYYRDDTVAFEAFKVGDIDVRRELSASKWASAYDFPAATDGRVIKNSIKHGRPERTLGFIFNTRRAPFDDIRVRKALNLLFDFEWVNEGLFHGQYKRIASYFPNSELAASGPSNGRELDILKPWKGKIPDEVFGRSWTPPSSASPEERRKNMVEADKLLNDAGWKVENGQRMKNGKPFVFEIIVSAIEDEKIALHFTDNLRKMGITASIRRLDAAAYIGRLNEYDFDMTLYYWLSTLSPGTEQILYWGCQAAKEPARWNYAGICDPAIDALAGDIAKAKDRESLVATVRAMDRILMAGDYMIPLYYAGRDNVAYWKPWKRPNNAPLYGMVLETWWLDKSH